MAVDPDGIGRSLGLYQRVYVVDALERAGLTLLTMPADALMRDRVCQWLMRRPAGFLMLPDASRVTGGQSLILLPTVRSRLSDPPLP